MEYCIIRRSIQRTQTGEVFAIRNIWDATPENMDRTQEILGFIAMQLNQNTSDAHTDHVVCKGSFASVLDAYNKSKTGDCR